MHELIGDKYVKAKKYHICSWCDENIPTGQVYRNQFLKGEDGCYHWKSCARCNFLFEELRDTYITSWDGLYTTDDFDEGIRYFCKDFVCPHCPDYDPESRECVTDKYPTECLDKIALILKNMYVDSQIRDAEKPYHYISNPYVYRLKPRDIPITTYPGNK